MQTKDVRLPRKSIVISRHHLTQSFHVHYQSALEEEYPTNVFLEIFKNKLKDSPFFLLLLLSTAQS